MLLLYRILVCKQKKSLTLYDSNGTKSLHWWIYTVLHIIMCSRKPVRFFIDLHTLVLPDNNSFFFQLTLVLSEIQFSYYNVPGTRLGSTLGH